MAKAEYVALTHLSTSAGQFYAGDRFEVDEDGPEAGILVVRRLAVPVAKSVTAPATGQPDLGVDTESEDYKELMKLSKTELDEFAKGEGIDVEEMNKKEVAAAVLKASTATVRENIVDDPMAGRDEDTSNIVDQDLTKSSEPAEDPDAEPPKEEKTNSILQAEAAEEAQAASEKSAKAAERKRS